MISTAGLWSSFLDRGHVGAGLLTYRELDDALELTAVAGEMRARAGVALMRLSGFSGSQHLAVLLDKRT